VIKFNCTNCGQKINVPEVHAGKKGKCPKCKTIVIVPALNEETPLKLRNNNKDGLQYVQQSPEPELRLKRDTSTTARFDGLSADGLNVTRESLSKPEAKELSPKRKLPWIVDIFLYPTSTSGLINIGIYGIMSLLLAFFSIFARFMCLMLLALFVIGLTVVSYMVYYLVECLRDSALGGIRAPENISSMPDDRSEAFSQFWDIIKSIIIFWSPVLGYFIYKTVTQSNNDINPDSSYNPRTDAFFWLLFGYGIFFFPMGLLAIIMFGSSSACNPFLWITSILKTFFSYCGLLLTFSVLAWLFFRITASFQGGILNILLSNILFMYVAMIAAHLLGRFYYINSQKLNWEV